MKTGRWRMHPLGAAWFILSGEETRTAKSMTSILGFVGILLVSTSLSSTSSFRGVIEGDTGVDVFLNGVYLAEDTVQPILPLNTDIMAVAADASRIFAVQQENPFASGDVLAIRGYAERPDSTFPVVDMLGKVRQYPTFPSAIAAFEDGTMTSSEWRCTSRGDLDADWLLPTYDDSDSSVWQAAVEHPQECCPWRDQMSHWYRLNAKWISPPGVYMNSSAPRQFFCRYTIPEKENVLPLAEVKQMSGQLPQVNVTRVHSSRHLLQVSFTLNDSATVYCGAIDALYELRAPTPLELIRWGISKHIVETHTLTWYILASASSYDYSRIRGSWTDASTLDVCKVDCRRSYESDGVAGCTAMTFYDIGYNIVSGKRCKLMQHLHTDLLDEVASSGQRMTHMYHDFGQVEHEIAMQTAPGTIYNTYCVATRVQNETTHTGWTGLHSTWDSVKSSKRAVRTEGCIDCSKSVPNIYILGGFASDTSITVITSADRQARIFCAARLNSTITPSADDIVADGWSNLVVFVGQSAQVPILNLVLGETYDVFCVAEADAGRSSGSAIEETRRRWYLSGTAAPPWLLGAPVPITKLSVRTRIDEDGRKDVFMLAKLSEIGYIWCAIWSSSSVQAMGVPGAAQLLQEGLRQKVEDLRPSVAGIFQDLPMNETHEVYCTSAPSDFANDTWLTGEDVLGSPYPIATISAHEIALDTIRLRVLLSHGPARVTCKAFPWQERPFTNRPLQPTPLDFDMLPHARLDYDQTDSAHVQLNLEFLVAGTQHDVYCYAEELQQDFPPGAIVPPKQGMTSEAISDTRLTFYTEGPQFEIGGWHCVAGRSCSIDLRGHGISWQDKLLARADGCPGPCRCSGQVDEWQKGGTCSLVHQGPLSPQPPPGQELDETIIDTLDPGGPWCYVDPGLCDDAHVSTYNKLIVSRLACSYNQVAGRPGSGPPGFPQGGIATRNASILRDGRIVFHWSKAPLLAEGRPYPVCYCNSTRSKCVNEKDFRLAIGFLHVSGPTDAQRTGHMSCVAGAPCVVESFEGHSLFNGSRLAVLPDTDQGCRWARRSIYEYPGVEGFPQTGISNPANADGRMYSWGSAPVVTLGGSYLLCWCGAVPSDFSQHRRRTTGRDNLLKAFAYTCAPLRPDGGLGYLPSAGHLEVIGPYSFSSSCGIGVECVIEGVQGHGLQGGDLMAVLRTCGDDSAPPNDWFRGFSNNPLPIGWQKGGWIQWGGDYSENVLADFGVLVGGANILSRGVYGFPNRGISAGPSEGTDTNPAGTYRWGGPTWSLAGFYKLCWCAASRGQPCFLPEHFRVDVGGLRVFGPAVLPAGNQVQTCIRGRRCDISELVGSLPPATEILIAQQRCGDAVALGVPNGGVSRTLDGNFFSWGAEPIVSSPGKYPICFCPNIGNCNELSDFSAFAGILIVKGSLTAYQTWFCGVGVSCNISGVRGEGFNEQDSIRLLANCGSGSSPATFENEGRSMVAHQVGTPEDPDLLFTLPPSSVGGEFQVCFCPTESICERPEDFFVELGVVSFGGPMPSQTYTCYEWRTCTITLAGWSLRDGDRLLAVPGGTDCSISRTSSLAGVEGWPNGGVSHHAFNGGASFTWGFKDKKDNYVLAKPGVYRLCWCSSQSQRVEGAGCGREGPFDVFAGSIRVAEYTEFMYLNRAPDPPPRDHDSFFGYLLAIPLPFLFCLIVFTGLRRHQDAIRARLRGVVEEGPEAPPLDFEKPGFLELENAQQRAQFKHEVEAVMSTRIDAEIGRKNAGTKREYQSRDVPRFFPSKILSFRERIEVKKKKRETQNDGTATAECGKSEDEGETNVQVGAMAEPEQEPHSDPSKDILKWPSPSSGPINFSDPRSEAARRAARRVKPPRFDLSSFGAHPMTFAVLNWESKDLNRVQEVGSDSTECHSHNDSNLEHSHYAGQLFAPPAASLSSSAAPTPPMLPPPALPFTPTGEDFADPSSAAFGPSDWSSAPPILPPLLSSQGSPPLPPDDPRDLHATAPKGVLAVPKPPLRLDPRPPPPPSQLPPDYARSNWHLF